MRRSSRLLFVAVALCSALAFAAPAALAAKPRVEVLSDGQGAILANGSLKAEVTVKLTRGRPATVSVKGASSTFDEPRFAALTESRSLSFRRSGSKTVKLALRPGARSEIRSCEGRTLRVSAGSGAGSAALVRDTASCKPKPVDLSRASQCDFIGAAAGLALHAAVPRRLLYGQGRELEHGPADRLTRACDAGQLLRRPHRPGPLRAQRRLQPRAGDHPRVPGLDNPAALANTNAVPINDQGRIRSDRNDPIVVIDTATSKRGPIWVEIDSNASTPGDTALLIHPAKNSPPGIATSSPLRNLKDSSGNTIPAPEGFRYYRDDLPSERGRDQRAARALRAGLPGPALGAGSSATTSISPGTSRSAPIEQHRPRMLHIRDDAFAQLGDTDLADGVVHGHRAVVQRRPTSRTRTRATESRAGSPARSPSPAIMTNNGEPCAPARLRPRLERQSGPERHLERQLRLHRPALDVDDPGHSPAARRLRPRPARRAPTRSTRRPAQPLPGAQVVLLRHRRDRLLRGRHRRTRSAILRTWASSPTLAERTQQGLLNELYLGPADGQPGRVRQRRRLPRRSRQRLASAPVIDTSEALLQRQQPGRHPRRRLHRDLARRHPDVAGRARDELLGAAQPLQRLRHLRGDPRPRLPEQARAGAGALDGADALGLAARPTATRAG